MYSNRTIHASRALSTLASVTIIVALAAAVLAPLNTLANVLPPEVTAKLGPVVPDSMPELLGRIPHRHALMKKPRAVVGYVSSSDWAFVEFITMTHASWRQLLPLAHGRYKIDLLVFAHPKFASQIQSICQKLDLDADFSQVYKAEESQCFCASYAPPPESVWHGYPFINNVHFFADFRVQQLLKKYYGYAMKTDFDTFLSPAILDHFPSRFTFGVQEYVVVEVTGVHLKRISADLGLVHQGQHNLGPMWYGDVASLVTMATYSIPVLYHIITQEFEQLPEGGLAQQWRQGEGWPTWSGGIAALYATEITANHMFQDFEASRKYDTNGDSNVPLSEVYHIHCRHGDVDFNKFDFFKHHYDHVKDLSVFDRSIVKGYTSYVAISTWRELLKLMRGDRDEL